MKKFRFSLQAVLEHCARVEEIQKAELNRLLVERTHLQRKLEETAALRETRVEELQNRKEIFPYEIDLYRRYINRLDEECSFLSRQLEESDRKIEMQRREVVVARQKSRVIEKLRKNRENEHAQEADRMLQQESDELFLHRRSRS
jgi:flagellar export protein FliJ